MRPSDARRLKWIFCRKGMTTLLQSSHHGRARNVLAVVRRNEAAERGNTAHVSKTRRVVFRNARSPISLPCNRRNYSDALRKLTACWNAREPVSHSTEGHCVRRERSNLLEPVRYLQSVRADCVL